MSQRHDEPAMVCEQCVALLTEYLEGTLTPEKSRALEEHLRICPDCAPYHANFIKTIELSRAAGAAAADRPTPATTALIESILKARKDIKP